MFEQFKGTVSRKLTPSCMLLYIVGKLPISLRIVRCSSIINFIKGPVYKLFIKFLAFTAHLHLKVQDFSKVLSLACSGHGNNCIFANKICKWRQMHVKTLISVCPTVYFQRPQHNWTHTWKEQCLHLNPPPIMPCKIHSKYGAHRKKCPSTNFLLILLWKNNV